MKKNILFAAVVLAFLALRAPSAVLDRIVAVVDDQIIMESELNEMARFSYQNAGRAVPLGAEFEAAKGKLLESMIEDKLLLKEAEAESIKVSRDEVMGIRDQKIQGFIAQVGSAEALDKVLQESYGLTLTKLKKNLEEQINEELIKMRLLEGLKQKNTPTKKEVERFFAEYRDSLPQEKSSLRLAHIMEKIEPDTAIVEAARRRIKTVEEKLLSGASFEKMAEQYSDDPSSAKNGGDLGFFSKGFLDKNFESAAFSLNVGEVSKITRSRYGFHLIRLEERKGEKEIRVRHILSIVLPGTDDTARAGRFLDSLKTACAADSAFSAAASAFSDDKMTQQKGGDLGWLPEDNMAPAFHKAVKDLEVHQNSAPVLIDGSFHIFRIMDRREERALDLDNDFNTIREYAANWKIKQEVKILCDRMRQKVYVENRLASGTPAGTKE